jgi:hypothetical protein
MLYEQIKKDGHRRKFITVSFGGRLTRICVTFTAEEKFSFARIVAKAAIVDSVPSTLILKHQFNLNFLSFFSDLYDEQVKKHEAGIETTEADEDFVMRWKIKDAVGAEEDIKELTALCKEMYDEAAAHLEWSKQGLLAVLSGSHDKQTKEILSNLTDVLQKVNVFMDALKEKAEENADGLLGIFGGGD